jgi:hypothetical protein
MLLDTRAPQPLHDTPALPLHIAEIQLPNQENKPFRTWCHARGHEALQWDIDVLALGL